MPRLVLDFEGVNLEGQEPIPAGVYTAMVDTSNSEVKKSQSGNDYLTITFVIQNHPEYSDRKITENYSLTEQARWKLGQLLLALGYDVKKNRKFTFDTREIHGKTCKIKVVQETYNDRIRNKVDAVMPLETRQVS